MKNLRSKFLVRSGYMFAGEGGLGRKVGCVCVCGGGGGAVMFMCMKRTLVCARLLL